MTQAVWFEEPPRSDPTYARQNEGTLSWLGRSTLPLAKDYRRFLNSNLDRLPRGYAGKLHGRLLEDGQHWRSAFFEMVVARTLQPLGAELEVGPKVDGSSRPDFRASFGAESVIVEATAPVFRGDVQEEMGRQNKLTAIIEAEAPDGWSVVVHEIPDLGPSDSKKGFKSVVRQLLDVDPPSKADEHRSVSGSVDGRQIELTLIPFDDSDVRIAGGPGAVWWGDGVSRIRKAVSQKRRQVRKASEPCILAINGSEIFSDWDDFDRALIGRRHAVIDVKSRAVVEDRFVEDGAFCPRGDQEPTFAGVLA